MAVVLRQLRRHEIFPATPLSCLSTYRFLTGNAKSSRAPRLHNRNVKPTLVDVKEGDSIILPKQRETGVKLSDKEKTASNCLQILNYMGGLDGEEKQLIKKLVNLRMKEGKKTRVRSMVYETFHQLARTERDGIKLMVDALENIKPICEVEKVGIAGNVYDVPGIVPKGRQQTLAIRWIHEAAVKRRTGSRTSLEKCLSAEILDAYRKRGSARKKREHLHGLASSNRSFAHFRWW